MKEHDIIIKGLKDFFRRSSKEKAIIGLSGGIDSAVCACLACLAVGNENVLALSMPSHISSQKSYDYAKMLSKNLEIKMHKVPIDKVFMAVSEELSAHLDDLSKGKADENLQARIRGMMLMAFANVHDGLVINTGNKTEGYLGYCTLYGDTVGAVAPIANLSKNKVYELARFINKDKEIIPQQIIRRSPTAELSKDQTDEKSLGLGYDVLSPLVDDIVDDKPGLNDKYGRQNVLRVKKLIRDSEFKRKQVPPGIPLYQ